MRKRIRRVWVLVKIRFYILSSEVLGALRDESDKAAARAVQEWASFDGPLTVKDHDGNELFTVQPPRAEGDRA